MRDLTTSKPDVSRAIERFDVDRLEKRSWRGMLLDRFFLFPYLQWVFEVLRWIKPVIYIPFLRLTLVLRYAEVCDVLSKSRQFPVPWGWKMKLVTSSSLAGGDGGDGRNFVLGMKEIDICYRDDYALLTQVFPYAEAKAIVAGQSRRVTESILTEWVHQHPDGSSAFDVIQELVMRVPTELCESYYGIPIADKRYFANCMLAVSSFVFGPEFDRPEPGRPTPKGMQMALDAAAPIRECLRSAMRETLVPPPFGGNTPSPLQRLMARPSGVGEVDDDRIHAQLFGMVLGFTPTNVLAAGNVLETLLRQPAFKARVVEAALRDDDVLLWKCLRETLRFRSVNVGPLRQCSETADVVGTDGRSTRIRQGKKVLACSQSAMFDRRQVRHPWLFDSDRADDDYLLFATGQHWCFGAYIAIEQITQMFKVLLTRYDVVPIPGAVGRMQRFNVFPLHMNVRLVLR